MRQGKYRKISVRIWSDSEFRALSDDAKLVLFHTLTNPMLSSCGALRGSVAGLAAELNWSIERYGAAFDEIEKAGMIEADHSACFVSIPNFLRYNVPESPNVVRSWGKLFPDFPECPALLNHVQRMADEVRGMSEAHQSAFSDALKDGLPESYLERLGGSLPESLPEGLTKNEAALPESSNSNSNSNSISNRNKEGSTPETEVPGKSEPPSPTLAPNGAPSPSSPESHKFKEELEALQTAWNVTAKKNSLPQMRGWTDARRRSALARLKDPDWRRDYAEALKRVASTPFLKGENKRGWKMSVDFFLKPDSASKIIEGSYGQPTKDLACPMVWSEDDPFRPQEA